MSCFEGSALEGNQTGSTQFGGPLFAKQAHIRQDATQHSRRFTSMHIELDGVAFLHGPSYVVLNCSRESPHMFPCLAKLELCPMLKHAVSDMLYPNSKASVLDLVPKCGSKGQMLQGKAGKGTIRAKSLAWGYEALCTWNPSSVMVTREHCVH